MGAVSLAAQVDQDMHSRSHLTCFPRLLIETAAKRLKSGDDGIELQFEVDHSRAGVVWRVVLVHERRIAWKGAARTTRPNGSFEVRRTLQDLSGADAVTARAWGPTRPRLSSSCHAPRLLRHRAKAGLTALSHRDTAPGGRPCRKVRSRRCPV